VGNEFDRIKGFVRGGTGVVDQAPGGLGVFREVRFAKPGVGSSLSEEGKEEGGPGRSGRFFGGEGVWNSSLDELNESFRGGVDGKNDSAAGVGGPSEGEDKGGDGGEATIFSSLASLKKEVYTDEGSDWAGVSGGGRTAFGRSVGVLSCASWLSWSASVSVSVESLSINFSSFMSFSTSWDIGLSEGSCSWWALVVEEDFTDSGNRTVPAGLVLDHTGMWLGLPPESCRRLLGDSDGEERCRKRESDFVGSGEGVFREGNKREAEPLPIGGNGEDGRIG
jgi:hypothetical protein